jgi:hypothetical protein
MSSRKLLIATPLLVLLLAAAALWWMRSPRSVVELRPPPQGTKTSAVEAAGATARGPRPDVRRSGQPPSRPGAKDRSVLAELGWGAGPDQLGRLRPEEANPEAPMSLTVDAQGRTVVLDQVNGRLLRLGPDGVPQGAVPLPLQGPQEVLTTADGRTLVLDRLVDKSVAILDEDGRLLGELPLQGPGLAEPGGITGLFVDGEDVYVEREHATLVKLGTTSGQVAQTRSELPGRPSRDGTLLLSAGLIDPEAGRFYLTALSRPEQTHLFTREYQLPVVVPAIVALDSDLAGTIYLAVLTDPSPGSPQAQEIRLLCLSPTDGGPKGQASLPATTMPEETFRDLAVLDQGGVLYAYRTEAGVQYQRVDCR